MQTTNITKKLSLFLCSVLIAATALFATGCSDTNTSSEAISSSSTASTVSSSSSEASDVSSNVSSDASSNSNVLGEGKSQFTLTVTDKDGKEESFEIHTDKTTVGDALVELGMIEGEDSEYGLYVKTVNGVTADYDKDGVYWAFYIDGEYASSGVDSTEITEGSTYSFKME
jgi:ABC-type Fe3+-hydroxamate transport system substrate-binding protein